MANFFSILLVLILSVWEVEALPSSATADSLDDACSVFFAY